MPSKIMYRIKLLIIHGASFFVSTSTTALSHGNLLPPRRPVTAALFRQVTEQTQCIWTLAIAELNVCFLHDILKWKLSNNLDYEICVQKSYDLNRSLCEVCKLSRHVCLYMMNVQRRLRQRLIVPNLSVVSARVGNTMKKEKFWGWRRSPLSLREAPFPEDN